MSYQLLPVNNETKGISGFWIPAVPKNQPALDGDAPGPALVNAGAGYAVHRVQVQSWCL
ncbi:MAG: hypothetical protein M0Q91_15760 [Methanoregula sp.]|nr:hypothetical protein [Methanoregula sp.]